MTEDPTDDLVPPGQHQEEPHRDGVAQRLNWLRAAFSAPTTASCHGRPGGRHRRRDDNGGTDSHARRAPAWSPERCRWHSVNMSRSAASGTATGVAGQGARELDAFPDEELEELVAIYVAKGASVSTARQLAEELTARDAFAAHVDAELGIDPAALTNPWHAALSSAVAFTVGSLLPLIAILASPVQIRVPVTFAAVVIALAVTGAVSARLGGAPWRRAVMRLVSAVHSPWLSPTASVVRWASGVV